MHHLQLRAELVQHLLKHIDTYSSQWDKEMPSGEIGDSFEKYIEEVAKPKTWCGLLELKALSRTYDSRITVIPRAPTETVFSVKPSQKKCIEALMFNGEHYDALIPAEGKGMPQAIKDITSAPPKVPMRGGGGSRCTVWTKSSSPAASGSRPSPGKPSASVVSGSRLSTHERRAPASRNTCWARDTRQCTRGPDQEAGIADPRGQEKAKDLDEMVQACANKPVRPSGRPPRCQWLQDGLARCRLCPFRAQATDEKAAWAILAAHFKSHHRGVTPSGGPTMSARLSSLVTELSADQDVAWQCRFCKCGISLEAASTAGEPRMARDKAQHKREAHPRITWKAWQRSDYADRALAATKTRFEATAQKRSVPGFVPFRWPRFAGKKSSCLVVLRPGLCCATCHAPFYRRSEAETHRAKCPSAFGRSMAPKRLAALRKLRTWFIQKAPKNPRTTAFLEYFAEAETIFQRAASPLP